MFHESFKINHISIYLFTRCILRKNGMEISMSDRKFRESPNKHYQEKWKKEYDSGKSYRQIGKEACYYHLDTRYNQRCLKRGINNNLFRKEPKHK